MAGNNSLKILLLLLSLAAMGCNRVSFSAETPLASEVSPTAQGGGGTFADDPGTAVIPPIKNPEPPTPSPTPTLPPPPSPIESKVTVDFPFQFQITNFPYMYVLSKISVQLQSGGSCQVVHKTELLEEGLCESDPSLEDFCSSTVVKTLAAGEDFTCDRLSRATTVKQNVGGSCVAQKKALTEADRAEVADPEVYGAGSSLAAASEGESGGDIEEMSDDIDVLSTLAGISHIGLTSDCQCYYENANDTGFKARWPALENHCERYFIEYQNLQP